MTLKRRDFFSRMAASGLALQTFANEVTGSRRTIRAIAFDAFPILDPRPVFALIDELYPGGLRSLHVSLVYSHVPALE
jgi:2-haloacid dehalogenase